MNVVATTLSRYSGLLLIIGGISFLLFSVSSVLKFFFSWIENLVAPLYIAALLILSVALSFSIMGYYYYAKRHSNRWGYIAAITAIMVAIGYTLLSTLLIGVWREASIDIVFGLAVTFSRIGLFFYSFSTIMFYFERYEGYAGGIGSILILLFGASYHFFAFISDITRTLPGAIMTMLASAGFSMQGYSMYIMGNKYVFKKPQSNIAIL